MLISVTFQNWPCFQEKQTFNMLCGSSHGHNERLYRFPKFSAKVSPLKIVLPSHYGDIYRKRALDSVSQYSLYSLFVTLHNIISKGKIDNDMIVPVEVTLVFCTRGIWYEYNVIFNHSGIISEGLMMEYGAYRDAVFSREGRNIASLRVSDQLIQEPYSFKIKQAILSLGDNQDIPAINLLFSIGVLGHIRDWFYGWRFVRHEIPDMRNTTLAFVSEMYDHCDMEPAHNGINNYLYSFYKDTHRQVVGFTQNDQFLDRLLLRTDEMYICGYKNVRDRGADLIPVSSFKDAKGIANLRRLYQGGRF